MPQRGLLRSGLSLVIIALGLCAPVAGQRPARFDHAEHLPLFPGSCLTCHTGAAESGAPLWPNPIRCEACHDGDVEARIEWAPPTTPAPSNLRFTHDRHRAATADSVGCTRCHTRAGAERTVVRRLVNRCIGCHQPGVEHLSVANAQCATCHVPLSRATQLSTSDVSRFPKPDSHRAPGFGLSGHGQLAPVSGTDGRVTVAASCATCHARNFCMNCHVNAPEVATIQALDLDERSLVLGFTFAAPPSHSAANFVAVHERQALRNASTCAACHTQESCATCHVGATLPKSVTAMHRRGSGRAEGALLARHPPASHSPAFREGHGREASASPRGCATCHVQADCLSCHRPTLTRPAGGGDFHPTGFLIRHPSAAYARQTSCGDCHNAKQFCVSCHSQAGLNATRSLGSSTFHDSRSVFILGHGQAARQALESCVSCHVERDCTACHSSVGRGFRFNPHGPGFDPERLRRRNPEMCIACHGRAIPGVP